MCVDLPVANTLNVGILATLAQYERELISQRTKAALQAKRERCKRNHKQPCRRCKLGNPRNFSAKTRRLGQLASVKAARDNELNRRAMELCALYAEKGWTLQQIADRLNSNGHHTRFQKRFKPETIRRLLKRAAETR